MRLIRTDERNQALDFCCYLSLIFLFLTFLFTKFIQYHNRVAILFFCLNDLIETLV